MPACRLYLWGMDDELQQRFFQLKLKELITDSTRPFPVMIFEQEPTKIIELIRRFCLFSPHMIPYKTDPIKIEERLEKNRIVDYGELYGLIFLC